MNYIHKKVRLHLGDPTETYVGTVYAQWVRLGSKGFCAPLPDTEMVSVYPAPKRHSMIPAANIVAVEEQ